MKIHLVIALASIENIEAVDKCLADEICADSGLECASPTACGHRTERHRQRKKANFIVILFPYKVI